MGGAQHQNCTQCLTDKKDKSLPREFTVERSLIAQGLMAPSVCIANYSHEQPHRLHLKDPSMCTAWLTAISESKLQGEKR